MIIGLSRIAAIFNAFIYITISAYFLSKPYSFRFRKYRSGKKLNKKSAVTPAK
jgi:hypothetical protein